MRFVTATSGLMAVCLVMASHQAGGSQVGTQVYYRGEKGNGQVTAVDLAGNTILHRETGHNANGYTNKYFWRSESGTLKEVPVLKGYSAAFAEGLSARNGVVVGRSARGSSSEGDLQAFAWRPATGELEGLGFLPGDIGSSATSVSADGKTVVGCSIGPKGVRPCVWKNTGKWECTELSALFTDNPLLGGTGLQVSPDGTKIVGSLTFKIIIVGRLYESHLYQWDLDKEGKWTRKEIAMGGVATGVNDKGMACGYYLDQDGERSFVVIPGEGLKPIGSLAKDEPSRARAINNSGVVVGHSGESGYENAYVWSDGAMKRLKMPEKTILSAALAINEKGQIAGYLGGEDDEFICAFVGSGATE
jgi:probable HAF family extracellular repeat protein